MHNQNENTLASSKNARILALNAGGEPLDWINYSECVKQMSKDNIVWDIQGKDGKSGITLMGGINTKTGLRSSMTLSTIVALKYKGSKGKSGYDYQPHLSNPSLFNRDRHLCAYCGKVFSGGKLTRDHVLPQSKKGPDIWDNVVTACTRCNQRKADYLLGDPRIEDMKLLYVPYTPNFYEHLILENRNILIDQMEFLMRGVGRHSRLHEEFRLMLEKQKALEDDALTHLDS